MRLRSLGFALGEAMRSLKMNLLMSSASAGTVAASLIALAAFLILALNLNYLASVVESQVEIKAYLSEELPPDALSSLRARIEGLEGVSSLEYVSKQEALERLRRQLGEQADLLEGIEGLNPLRDSFEVRTASPADVRRVALQLGDMTGIEDVNYRQDILGKLFALTSALRILGFGAVILLAGVTVFIVSNTIRLTIYARRREIGIMKLVGASDSLIRWPFVIEGVALGLAGSAASSLVVWNGYEWLFAQVSQAMPFLPMVPPREILGVTLGALFALGAFIGSAGSALSVRRYLRAKGDRL